MSALTAESESRGAIGVCQNVADVQGQSKLPLQGHVPGVENFERLG